MIITGVSCKHHINVRRLLGEVLIRGRYFTKLLRMCGIYWIVALNRRRLKEAIRYLCTYLLYTYIIYIYTSSHRRCFTKKDVLKNVAKFTGKHQCWSLLKLKAWGPATVLERDYSTGVFRWIAKILRTPNLKSICVRLLLFSILFSVYTHFFISNAFFNSALVLLNFFMNWASNVA